MGNVKIVDNPLDIGTADLLVGSDWDQVAAWINAMKAILSGLVLVSQGDNPPTGLTNTQLTALLDVFTSTLKGLVPSSGGGTTNYLRADGSWAPPTGGGDMVLASTQTVTGAKTFLNLILKLRNPANTFSGQILTPALTADANLQIAQSSEATIIVYVDGNTGQYTAKDVKFNAVISNGTVAETVIQAAITAAAAYGTVIIRPYTYTLSGSFTGFTFLYNQKILMAHGAQIIIPNGYTGKVFKLVDTSTNSNNAFEGGVISEAGTPAKLWTCFDLNATTTTGLINTSIKNCRIVNAGIGIDLRTDTNGWVNASNVYDVSFDLCVIGAKWTHTGTYTDGQSGGNNNTFYGCIQQATTGTTHGFRDVNGRRNAFINCYPADFVSSMITCNITANARSTIILGGSTTYLNFDDQEPAGSRALIRDAYQNDVVEIRKTYNYEDSLTTTAPANPATGYTRRYSKQVDANNDGLFVKRKINGAMVEVQL